MNPATISDLLVVAPHPDDEVIGCGGLIQHVRAQGGRVTVAIVSDGAASHPGSAAYPPHRLRAARRRESRAALAHLGVAGDRVHFMDLPDGGSDRWDRPDRLDALLSRPFDAVALPSPFDNHADHRAAHHICRGRTRARVLNYLVWPHEDGRRPPPDAELAIDIAPYRVRKAEALLHYATQLGAITDADWNFAIDQPLFQRFTAPVERFHL
ncbi:PIG-L family deacetylase [uncultured Algimonas sp.]|uniref:PIG-L deacetylase family protein n=1 Tax=uncultured Algimonas sp. TaxID=1547920 RepID=UPI002601E340|nr:PIG-L family deacetylase [uncultured Algimonas sp.]